MTAPPDLGGEGSDGEEKGTSDTAGVGVPEEQARRWKEVALPAP